MKNAPGDATLTAELCSLVLFFKYASTWTISNANQQPYAWSFDIKPQLASDFIRRTVVTNQTLVAVATSDISFAGAVPTNLVARSSHHDDATRVTVASWWRYTQTHTHTHTHTKNETDVLFTDLKCRLCGFIFQTTRNPFSALFKHEKTFSAADKHTHTYADNPVGRSGWVRNNLPCSRRSACLWRWLCSDTVLRSSPCPGRCDCHTLLPPRIRLGHSHRLEVRG